MHLCLRVWSRFVRGECFSEAYYRSMAYKGLSWLNHSFIFGDHMHPDRDIMSWQPRSDWRSCLATAFRPYRYKTWINSVTYGE